MYFIRRNWVVILMAAVILVWFTIVKVNRVPEPEPATAHFGITNDGFGVILDVSMENLAFDCKLSKKVLEEMNDQMEIHKPLLGMDTKLPGFFDLMFKLPDGRRFEDTYHLRFWNDELILEQSYCHEVK